MNSMQHRMDDLESHVDAQRQAIIQHRFDAHETFLASHRIVDMINGILMFSFHTLRINLNDQPRFNPFD